MNDNIIKAFFDRSQELSDKPCAHFEVAGKWESRNWSEVCSSVRNVSAGLIRMGIKKGDSVVIYGRTKLEWAIADFAIMAAGAICVPIYQSFNMERVAFILKDSRPKMAIVEDEALLGVLDDAIRSSALDGEIKVVSMDHVEGIISVADLSKGALSCELQIVDETVKDIQRDDIATYVYTSGTTGDLKGVVLTHGNIISEIRAAEHVFCFSSDEIGILWLPLAHVLGRMMEVFHFVHGCQTAFANDMNRLQDVYREIRPHFVCGVPRMLEKIYERVLEHIESSNGISRAILKWGIGAGLEYGKLVQKHRPASLILRIKYFLANKIVFRKLRSRLGGRLRCFICGGAKLTEEIGRFFHSVGISVLEGYGLTETFAAATVNRFDDFHFGTVGKPLQGVELKLSNDGEILINGPTVFRRYLNRPEDTKNSFTEDGWFKTGDIGEYSRDGFLRITGRKKEIIITAGGKNIASQMIETIMSDNPYIRHFVVYGDGKRYLTGLVTLNHEAVTSYLEKHGCPIEDGQSISRHPAVKRLISKHVEEQNKKLASFETIKRFEIIDGDFTIEGGELTPTMKIRRKAIAAKYGVLLDSLY